VTRHPCEHRHLNGHVCGAEASWNVSLGRRRYDAQDSCCRHLSATVQALGEGEGRDVTVRPVWAAGRQP
jgi:hypothetical protein